MKCFIYRSNKKTDTYLYLAEQDNYSCVPAQVLTGLGRIEYAMELELTADTRLAREKTARVISNLEQYGFHIQLPDNLPVEELLARLAGHAVH